MGRLREKFRLDQSPSEKSFRGALRAEPRLARGLFLASLAVTASLTVAGAPEGHEPSPTISPSVSSGSVAVGSFLRDTPALQKWLKERNPDLLAARARVDQASAELAQQRLYPNPEISASAGDIPAGVTNPPGLRLGDTAIYSTALSETLEIGKRGPRIASARLRMESESQSFLQSLMEKTAEARYALARTVYLKVRLSVLEGSLDAARQNMELQRSRLENGDLSGNDFDRLQVDTMLLESELAANRQEYEGAAAECGSIVFASCEAGESDLTALNDSAPVSDSPDVETALRRRPDLRALGLNRDSASQDAILAHRRRIPDPSLTVGYTHDNLTLSGDQPKTLQLGVAVPLPIFDRGQHEAARAERRAFELEETALAERERGRAEISALLKRKGSLETTLRTLQEEAVPTSSRVLESTLAAVNRGGMSMTDLLLARRTHTDLLLKVMDLQFDLFSVRNDLRRALGLDAEDSPEGLGT